MKRILFVLAVALALAGVSQLWAQDANLHRSKIPKDTLQPWRTGNEFIIKKAMNGDYPTTQHFVFNLFIQSEQTSGATGYLYIGTMGSVPGFGTWIVVFTPEQVSYFQKGMEVWFYAHYQQSVSVTQTRQDTGEQRTIDLPLFVADQWGIHIVN